MHFNYPRSYSATVTTQKVNKKIVKPLIKKLISNASHSLNFKINEY